MTHITTDTTTAPPSGAPREAHQRACLSCLHIDLSDTLALADGVGWCVWFKQYRVLMIGRECKERETAA